MSDTQGLNAGDNPIADAMAKRHVELLMKTGMAYEFSPETIATRAFLDGFAAICGVLDEVKEERDAAQCSLESSQAAHDAVAAELKLVMEERNNYAHWLNESGHADYTNIQKVLELEWELNYAVHCVTKVEELWKKLTHIENELRAVKEERDRARAEALGNAARFRDADARRAENYRMITTIQGERDTLRRELEHVAQCSQNRDSENAELVALLQDVIEGSVDSTTYPDGPNLARDLRAQLRDAISRHAKGEANG